MLDPHRPRQRQRHQRERRRPAHRRDVAHVDGQRLPTDVLPGDLRRQEVHARDHRVRGRNDVPAVRPPHRRVVADADHQALVTRRIERLRQPVD
jgi:hypothetical protein